MTNNLLEELAELELETEEGECFTLGHAISEHCVKQLVDFILSKEIKDE